MREEVFTFSSADGKTTGHGVFWLPEGKACALVQVLHGMSEYIERYRGLASFLTQQGFAVVGHDHLGHGQSVSSPEEYGFFAEEEPNQKVVRDIRQVSLLARKRFPDVPYILFGHSMGSFLARQFLCLYGKELDGAVICGTGTIPRAAVTLAKMIAKTEARVKGGHYRSALLLKLSMGSYNKQFEPVRTPFDWLSVNEENVDAYIADPKCGFPFTANGYLGMFTGIEYIQRPDSLARMPKDLPVLFIAGDRDPVGNNGQGVTAAAEMFRKAGMKDVSCILYKGDRHEILNENDRDQVQQDILEWMKARGFVLP